MRRIPPIVAASLVLVLVFAPARPASATPGALDRSFAGNGIQTMFRTGATAQAVAIDAQDRIVVAGYTIGTGTDVAVARLRPGGAPDGTFGGDGRVRIDLGAADRALDVAVARDGTVVVVGERLTRRRSAWFVVRLRENGSRDASFGGDGVVVTDFGRRFEHATAVALQSNGKIVVGGSVSDGVNEQWAFVRYHAGGARDGSFGGDGRVSTSLSISGEQVQDLAIGGNGILAGGYAEVAFRPRFAIAKLRFDGLRAAAWGTNGVRILDLGPGADAAFALAVHPDGRPILAGYAGNGGRHDWGVVRLRAGGGRDRSFGGNGVVVTPFSSAYELATSVAIQGDGRIVVAGTARGAGGTMDLALVRYRRDGGLNRSFSGNGRALFNPFGGDDGAQDVVIHGGKIVVVGESMRGLVPRMIALRLHVT